MKKAFKILSVLLIIFAVLYIVLAALSLAGSVLLTGVGIQDNSNVTAGAGVLIGLLGGLLLFYGVFALLTGIFGVRGANGSSPMAGAAKVMGIIGLVVCIGINVLGCIVSSNTLTEIVSILISVGLQLAFVYLAFRVQDDDRQPSVEA